MKSTRRPIVGFTLIEVMITLGIMVIALAGLLHLFAYCLSLGESSRNMTLAMARAQGVMEDIRNHDFARIAVDYAPGGTPGNVFNLTQPEATGVIYITALDPQLLRVKIEVSWREKAHRVFGEDRNLDGVLDPGEDTNGNAMLDSPASVTSLITHR